MESDPSDPRIMDGSAWKELCETLQGASKLVLGPKVPDTPRERAEGFRYLSRFLAAGIVLLAVTPRPLHGTTARADRPA